MLYLFILALVLFVTSSFYVKGRAERIRLTFQQKYPEVLAALAPDVSDTWKHFAWQSAFNVAQAVLHHVAGLDDVELSRDAVRFKVGMVALFVTWGIMVVSFIAWTQTLGS